VTTHADAISQVYARSLYELAEQAGGQEKIAEVADELAQIGELLSADRRLGELFASVIIDRGRRAEALRRMFADRVTDLTLRFLLVLNERGRLGRLRDIADAYDLAVQEAYGRVEVDVFTSAPLDDEAREALRARIQSAIGREPVLYGYTDPSLIGGLKLRIGDQLIDGSVATRLRRMRQTLDRTGGLTAHERGGEFFEETSS
jgi:F-type H+-transporting ATPase subunit delta